MANACQIVELWECECFLAIFGVPFRIGRMASVLEFDQITKEYRSFSGRRSIRALDGFSVQVEAGEIFGFLGPNGAGKSTAIHLAMGFMRPTSGQGRMLGAPFGHPLTRRRVGFLAENVALYHRPAEKLIRFYGALNGMAGLQLAKRTRDVLQIVGLQEHARRNIGKFSRGMLQRAGLAEALINDPELLILDEPTSALDPLARVMVRELLLSARNNGKTIFLSSHLLSEVELVCDRVAVLHRGKLVRLGRTADLLQSSQRTEIIARGIAATAFAGSFAQNGIVRFSVPAADQRLALERVWILGGEIVSVNPVRRSLEEVFLEVTRDSRAPAEGTQ
jgi:ABC-2 type transport system ATP-binding protein